MKKDCDFPILWGIAKTEKRQIDRNDNRYSNMMGSFENPFYSKRTIYNKIFFLR